MNRLTKRLRYEVLRRDNHACRYCGQMAPEVRLTVDHVHPIALGGTNHATNLVTACTDCNAGKSSMAPDAAIVDDVEQDALRWSRAINMAVGLRRYERIETQVFLVAWQGWHTTGTDGTEIPIPIDPDWHDSIVVWSERGLDIDELVALIPTAMKNRSKPLRPILPEDRWRYFCGVAWKALGKIEADARTIIDRNLDGEDDPIPATPFEAGDY